MEVKNLLAVVKAANEFVVEITKNPATINEVEALGRINPSINEDLIFLKDWMDSVPHVEDVTITETPIPDNNEDSDEPWLEYDPSAEWRIDHTNELAVSENGKFWSIKDHKPIEPVFVNGELRIPVDENDKKRAGVIIAKCFRIKSFDIHGDYVLSYKNGDHRDLHPTNLIWKLKEDVETNSFQLLIEDICRRIVEHAANIPEILKRYEGADPGVDRHLVESILIKEKYSDISDKFFVYTGDKIVPRSDTISSDINREPVKLDNPTGFDISNFLRMSGDKTISRKLLAEKINDGKELTVDEKDMIIFSAIEKIGGKKTPSTNRISKMIYEMYKIEFPFDFINTRKIVTNEISRIYSK